MKRFILYIILSIGILFFLSVYFGDSLCTKNKPVTNADILIIEGWVPANQLEEISKTFKFGDYIDVIVTGNDFDNNFPSSNMKTYTTKGPVFLGNGAILLKNELKKTILLKKESIKRVNVYAKGTKCKGINAHFTLFLNNKIVGQAFVDEYSQKFSFDIDNVPDTIAMFVLNFDNDIKIGNEDRNLIIDSIVLGDIRLTRKDFNLARNDYPERFGFGFTSNAERAYHYFLSLKPSKNLHFIAASALQRNFTKYSAIACSKWIQKKYPGQSLSINVVSTDFHSARSYYTFKSELKNCKVGIISMKSTSSFSANRIGNFRRVNSILEEYAGIITAIL